MKGSTLRHGTGTTLRLFPTATSLALKALVQVQVSPIPIPINGGSAREGTTFVKFLTGCTSQGMGNGEKGCKMSLVHQLKWVRSDSLC